MASHGMPEVGPVVRGACGKKYRLPNKISRIVHRFELGAGPHYVFPVGRVDCPDGRDRPGGLVLRHTSARVIAWDVHVIRYATRRGSGQASTPPATV